MLGGVSQGTLVKSKKSMRSDWTASRAVSVCPPKNLVSTSLMMAVWSIGMCETQCLRVNGESTTFGRRNPNWALNPKIAAASVGFTPGSL